MTTLPIPIEAVYAGLGGTLLALIVATAQNRWSAKVFFLLALRLAIGWHFLFEGLYKVHSHYAGPTETTKPFTSEPYFKAAPGPVGAMMRRQFGDPAGVIADRVKAARDITPEAFAKLPAAEQAAACPESVARELDAQETATEEAIKAEATAAEKSATETEALALTGAKTDADRAKIKATADAARADAKKKAESFKESAQPLILAAKAKYARWVYGVDGRAAKVKFISGTDPLLTAPQRLAHLDVMRGEAKDTAARQSMGLGNGYGTEAKRAAETRADAIAAEADVARDANAFVAELQGELTGGKAVIVPPEPTLGRRMDIVTMWFLVAVGGMIMAGLFTRLACVLAAGFLVTTYLNHPPFPWFPLPPGTEGNPVFVNKNVIECLALLALASMPTGRWLGLDALIAWAFGCRTPEPTV